MTEGVFCTRCGDRNARSDLFCTGCGAAREPALTMPHPVLLATRGEDQVAQVVHEAAVLPLLLVRKGRNAGSRFALVEGHTPLGRDPSSAIFLNDITVSRQHAVIVCDDTGCRITDQGSLNGTNVNGRLMDRPTPLRHGDELRLGAYVLVCLYPRPSTSEEPEAPGPRRRDND